MVVVHGDSENGFVGLPNALLMFKLGSKSDEYHNGMNYENYGKWMTKMLIMNLNKNCV